MTIHSALSGKSIPEIENSFANKGYGDFKTEVAEVVTSYFTPIRKKAEELLADPKGLEDALADGAEKAREVAAATLSRVYDAIGLVRPKKS